MLLVLLAVLESTLYFPILSLHPTLILFEIWISENDLCNLLCRGADPRAVNGEGKTSLDLAVESNFADSEILALLSDANG